MIKNPFRKDDIVVIPKGLKFRTTNGATTYLVTKRTQRVRVHHTLNAYEERHGYPGYPSYITWAGTGGYWKDVEVTQELLDANPELVAKRTKEANQ